MLTLFPSKSRAFMSACGRYRWSLSREWGDAPPVCWIMLNPSTADAEQDDPTIRRCMGFARSWGAGGIYVLNLWALRATNPDELLSGVDGSIAIALNDATIGGLVKGRRIIAAWGSHKIIAMTNRDRIVMKLLAFHGFKVECLGVTKGGYPRHPLYIAGKVEPVIYTGRPS